MLAFAFALVFVPQQPTAAYDPLALPEASTQAAQPLDLAVADVARERTIPLRVWLPAASPAPVVLWSHGLGGSRDNAPYLGRHWSARGYVVVCMQHAGSDESVWRGVRLVERMGAMRLAASTQNLRLRVEDVRAVLDQLGRWHSDAGHALHGRLDLEHVGMTGHSFGAVTTQAVAGQAMPLFDQQWTDARIDAALPMSPSSPAAGDARRAFAKVTVPWLLMTGTKDDSPIGNQTPESRREVFPALPATIDRYELVLHDALHGAFGERPLPGEGAVRKAQHHRAILGVSTAFWDAYLRGDAAARAFLQGDAARSMLAAEDLWQAATGAATTGSGR
jgi:predicted dienelactone hydrolase